MNAHQKLFSAITATAILTSTVSSANEIIEPTGLNHINEIIATDTRLAKRVSTEDLQKAQSSVNSMNTLIKEAIQVEGLANDGLITVSDVKEINRYLVSNHLETWYTLRGESEDTDSTGYYLVDRRGIRSNTSIMNRPATKLWGFVYNLGFETTGRHNNKITDYTGSTVGNIRSVGYILGEILKNEVSSGALYNSGFLEVTGSTGTALDNIVVAIMGDEGLHRRTATNDIRDGSKSADAMSHLILEAIVQEGLANDNLLSTADIRQINHYLVDNYKNVWAELHGDDETSGEETGYHLVQNDGAFARMFADNVINTVADGIFHLGFETDLKNRLRNEDGDANQRFEKVAWWLDTLLKEDMKLGKLHNSAYQEVVGTTGTSFDKIVLFIYHDKGLQLKVSMEDIRVGAASANSMNVLLVEAITQTDVAKDNSISIDDVKTINNYLVTNYASQWSELHGDDEDNGEEIGYHRIQNDGAQGVAYNKNIINNLADGIYHLGFETPYKDRLVNEDGNKNVSFKNVAYYLNKSLKEDFKKGLFN